MPPIHIYTTQQSSRLTYIADYLFTSLLPFEKIIFLSNLDSFANVEGIKLNYSAQHMDNVLQIFPHTILFETNITSHHIEMEMWREHKCFFKTGTNQFPYDLLAASFYLTTRYEEYLPFTPDQHLRFQASQSLAYREGFLHLPLVQYYASSIYHALAHRYNLAPLQAKPVINLPGIDVDNAYAYLHKGFIRTLGGIVKDVTNFNFANMKQRIQSLLTGNDPFDTYDFILTNCKAQKLKPCFFIMTASQSTYDRNLSHTNAAYIKLIKSLSKKAGIGLHPGYQSDDVQVLKNEVSRCEKITACPILNSRQHFLKLKFPNTYHNLIQCGIKNDFTMGFADACGFRASTAMPFYFFDLEKNHQTDLLIHPIAYMDANFVFYQKKSPAQAMVEINLLHEEVKKFGGLFHYIWHNETVNNKGMWHGWQDVFLKTLLLQ